MILVAAAGGSTGRYTLSGSKMNVLFRATFSQFYRLNVCLGVESEKVKNLTHVGVNEKFGRS